ncbi:MAG: biotin--[acetyl-CoA-carboxylase] ligase [candidate division WOR-3 bacterium]
MAAEQTIAGELLARLTRFGRVYLLDTVGSTNDYAFSLAARKEPAVVVARRQTKGRGRFRRRWFADEDSLIFSLLLFTESGFPQPAAVTQIAGLALCRAIELGIQTAKPPAMLRWPNDVVISNKKVAGILCEQRGQAVVVGVGVNVNQRQLPENLPEAGSLFSVYGQACDKMRLLDLFLEEFSQLLTQMKKGNSQPVWEEIRQRSAVINHRVEVKTLLRRHLGTVIDIDDEGRIVLRSDSGRLVVLSSGQVRQLR